MEREEVLFVIFVFPLLTLEFAEGKVGHAWKRIGQVSRPAKG